MLGVLRSNQETAGVLRRRRCEMTTTEDIYEQGGPPDFDRSEWLEKKDKLGL